MSKDELLDALKAEAARRYDNYQKSKSALADDDFVQYLYTAYRIVVVCIDSLEEEDG